jgi:hypothetical protein
MKKYLKYLKGDLLPALEHLPTPETFGLLYGDGFEKGDLSNVPVKTLAEWLGIDLQTLPPADRLTAKQQLAMANVLLSYWQDDDELALIIRGTKPKRQYETAIEYISLQGRYNGYGGFELIETPISDEEWAEIRKTQEKMMKGLDLFFRDTEKEDKNEVDDADLPF